MTSLLQVNHLSMTIGSTRILQEVSLEIKRGHRFGLVGASGAGKSMLASATLGLLPHGSRITGGEIFFQGHDLLKLSGRQHRKLRGPGIGYLVQNTMSGLDPVCTIRQQMVEVLRAHDDTLSKRNALNVSAEWLEKVGFSDVDRILDSYPFQLSGGMAQRVYMAMIFMLSPSLVIADEIGSGLDATTTLEMIGILMRVSADAGLLLITHDIRLLVGITQRMAVMYQGIVFESGRTRDVLEHPIHPYTRALVNAARSSDENMADFGTKPLRNASEGCAFLSRCPSPCPSCSGEAAPVKEIEGRLVRCHRC